MKSVQNYFFIRTLLLLSGLLLCFSSCNDSKLKAIEENNEKLAAQNEILQKQIQNLKSNPNQEEDIDVGSINIMTPVIELQEYKKDENISVHKFANHSGQKFFFVVKLFKDNVLGDRLYCSDIKECFLTSCSRDKLYRAKDNMRTYEHSGMKSFAIHVIYGSYSDASNVRQSLKDKKRVK